MVNFGCIYFLTFIFLMLFHGISWLVMFSGFIFGLLSCVNIINGSYFVQ
jgi:hypothetical protein